jgi:hypothetical protein
MLQKRIAKGGVEQDEDECGRQLWLIPPNTRDGTQSVFLLGPKHESSWRKREKKKPNEEHIHTGYWRIQLRHRPRKSHKEHPTTRYPLEIVKICYTVY